MKVPPRRTPQEQPVAATEGYGQSYKIDYSPIISGLNGISAELTRKRREAESFQLQTKLLEETTALQTDFDARKKAAPLGAPDFTPKVLQDYEERHNKLLGELQAQGYSSRDLQDFSLRLGHLRAGVGETALAFEAQSLGVLAKKDGEALTTSLSQYATANPLEGYGSALQENEAFWRNYPGISAVEREIGLSTSRDLIRQSAAKGLALTNPGLVLEKLDPQDVTAPTSFQQTTPTNFKLPEGLSPDKNTVGQTLLQGGLPLQVVAGFLGNFDVEGGYNAGLGDGGSASGIAQWRENRRAAFKAMFGKDPHQATKAEQAQFVLYEMNNPEKAGMTVKQRDEILAAPDAETAAELIDEYYERSSGVHRDKRKAAATKYIEVAVTEVIPQPVKPTNSTLFEGTTGVKLLDDLSGAERLQVIGWAREKTNQQTASIKGAMNVTVENAVTSFMTTGEFAGPVLTKEQLIQVYGPIEGEQKWAEYDGARQAGQVIQRVKTLSPTAIQAELAKIAPKPTSPTYAQDQLYYAKTQEAVNAMLKSRSEDPAAYVLSAYPNIATGLNSAKSSTERRAVFAQMSQAFDQLGIPKSGRVYLPQAAVAEIGQRYKMGGATDKRGILESLLYEMGNSAGPTLVKGAGDEVARDLAIYALMVKQPGGRDRFLQVMRGREAIAKDPARKPSPEAMNSAFAGKLKASIRNLDPAFSSALNEAAAAVYVDQGGQSGAANYDTGRVGWDQDLYDKAVNLVLGGNGDVRNTGIVNLSEGQVKDWTILPAGVNKTQFTNWFQSLNNTDIGKLTGGEQPRDQNGQVIPLWQFLDEGVPVLLGPGMYGVKLSSDGKFVGTRTGRPLILRVDATTIGGK